MGTSVVENEAAAYVYSCGSIVDMGNINTSRLHPHNVMGQGASLTSLMSCLNSSVAVAPECQPRQATYVVPIIWCLRTNPLRTAAGSNWLFLLTALG